MAELRSPAFLWYGFHQRTGDANPDDLAITDRALAVIGIALTLIGIAAVTWFPQMTRRLAWAGFVGGLLLPGMSIALAFPSDGNAVPTLYQGTGSLFSYSERGGVTAGTISTDPQPRSLSRLQAYQLKQSLLAFPKDKTINVLASFGDPESLSFATEIYEFMKLNGFQMKDKGPDQAIFPEPLVGIGERQGADGSIDIQVGANQ